VIDMVRNLPTVQIDQVRLKIDYLDAQIRISSFETC
jgi:hypothetical protein